MIEKNIAPPVVKVGNLDSMRTFADVRDAVRAYFMMLTVKPVGGSYYNIGGDHSCTVGEMLNTLIGMSTVKNIKVETDPDRLRPIDADLQIPDTSKFRSHTGWTTQYSFEQTMQDLLNYWRERVSPQSQFLVR